MAEAVLLTGATGFVGRAVLAELVARGRRVAAVARRAPGPDLPGVRWRLADLLDPEARARLIADAPARRMIHCAWYVKHGAFWTSPANALWCEASADLAARFLAAGGRRIVATGSCAEYALHAPGRGPWPETRPIDPATPYGRAKAALHHRLAALCGAAGAGLVWARLFHLYGPGEPPERLAPSIRAALDEGRVAEVRAAELIRDFASTAHVARCLVSLMDSAGEGAFNIGSGAPVRLGALAGILAARAGRPDLLRLSHNPGPDDPAEMLPDLTRLRAAIGPVAETPEDGLGRLYDHS